MYRKENVAKMSVTKMRKCTITIVALLIVFLSTSTVFAVTVVPNPNITIVNPVSERVIFSDSLLVSVKMTAPISIRVSVTQEFKVVNDVNTSVSLEEFLNAEQSQRTGTVFGTPGNFTSTSNLSFYTKKVENVRPGVYKITVETIDEEDDVTHVNISRVEVKAVEDNPENQVTVDTQNSGPAQFLRNLLRAIFGE